MHTLYPVRLELPIGFSAESPRASGLIVFRFAASRQIWGQLAAGWLANRAAAQ